MNQNILVKDLTINTVLFTDDQVITQVQKMNWK
jgi:hypothetical protein